MKVIDFRVRLRTSQLLIPWNPQNPAPHFEQYIKLYKMEPRLSEMDTDDFVKMMKDGGIDKGVVCGGNIDDNDHLIELKKQGLDKHFYFIGGLTPRETIMRNLEEIDRIKDEGLLGVNLSPFIFGLRNDARELFPIYAYCEYRKLVVIMHGSLHYDRFHSTWLSHPKYVDQVAIHFPKLKIVVSHAGNGFGNIGLAVAQRHPNLYLEYSALWPKYLPDYFLHAANSYLRERCLFGTDYPLVEFSPFLKAWKEVINPENHQLFFEKNAERALFGEPV